MESMPADTVSGLGALLPSPAATGSGAVSGGTARQEPPFVPGTDGRTPHKPLSDTRSYRYLTLPNGLRALLVHDPAADKAAAALSVAAGHMADPWQAAGVAHFNEHLLFLGTERYPDENEYKKFLKDHGGGSNASTGAEATTYHFTVHHEHLQGALARFAPFFICPLFTPSATERELNAVDSEDKKNRQDDGRRQLQLWKEEARRDHPYSKFGTGNATTLQVGSRDLVLQFYGTYYSANIMTLAVLGRQSLDDLELLVRGAAPYNAPPEHAASDFATVPNKDIPRPVDLAIGHPYQAGQTGRHLFLVPVRDTRSFTVQWPVPDPPHPDYTHGYRYLSHLLGHEGKGSLLALLKKLDYATELSAGASSYAHFTTMSVTINLTKAGLAATDEVLRLLYQYIAMLRAADAKDTSGQGMWRAVYDEISQTASNRIRFKPLSSPLDCVTSAVAALREYPAVDVLVGPSLLPTYDPTLARTALACLTPGNAMVLTCAKAVAPDPAAPAAAAAAAAAQQPALDLRGKYGDTLTTTTERYYGFSYMAAPYTAEQWRMYGLPGPQPAAASCAAVQVQVQVPGLRGAAFDLRVPALPLHPDLALPEPNTFIPSDFSLKVVDAVKEAAEEAAAAARDAAPLSPASTDAAEGRTAIAKATAAVTATPELNGADAAAAASTAASVTSTPATPAPPSLAALAVADTDTDTQVMSSKATTTTGTAIASPASAQEVVRPPHPLDMPWAGLLTDASGTGTGGTGTGLQLSTAGQPLHFTRKYPTPHLLHVSPGAAPPWSTTDAPVTAAAAPGTADDAAATTLLRKHLATLTAPASAPAAEVLLAPGNLPMPVRLWWKQDTTFKLPKSFVISKVYLPAHKQPATNMRHHLLLQLYVSCLEDVLNEATYAASIASLGFSVGAVRSSNALSLSFSGYSHTLPRLMDTVLAAVATFPATPDDQLGPIFARRLDALKRGYDNFTKAQPYARGRDAAWSVLYRGHLNRTALLAACGELTVEHLRTFSADLFDTAADVAPAAAADSTSSDAATAVATASRSPGASFECFVYGNADRPAAATLAAQLSRGLAAAGRARPAAELAAAAAAADAGSDTPRPRVVLLSPGTEYVVTRTHPNAEERNASVDVMWQLGAATPRTEAAALLLEMLMSEPAFDTLRTKQALGYLVWSGHFNLGDSGVALFVTVQSAVASVAHLQARIEAFLLDFRAQLADMSEAAVADKIAILAYKLLEPDKTQSAEANRLWSPLSGCTYDCHTSEAVAAAVRQLCRADLIAILDACVMPGAPLLRKLVSRVVAQPVPASATAPAAPGAAAAAAAPAVLHDGGSSTVPPPHPRELPEDQLPAFHAAVLDPWAPGPKAGAATPTGVLLPDPDRLVAMALPRE